MKKFIHSFVVIFLFTAIYGCNDYVSNIQQPIDDVSDEQLNHPNDIPLLINGVKGRFARFFSNMTPKAGGLSDELEFTRDIKNATYVEYLQIDLAKVSGENSMNGYSVTVMPGLCQLRLLADTLVYRINNFMTFDTSQAHAEYKRTGLFTGYFYGAIARYLWAAYWSLEPNDGGGGVINLGPYIPAAQMYKDAVSLLDKSLEYAAPDEVKIVNTLKARIYLITGKYNEAAAALDKGLTQGDPPFQTLYNIEAPNLWYNDAGGGRTQFHAADRFGDYVYKDPKEAARIPIFYVTGSSQRTYSNDTVIAGHQYKDSTKSARFYVQQNKYNSPITPMDFLSWQEAWLMKAEIAIRNNNNATGLALVNEVRASHGLDILLDSDIQDGDYGSYINLIYIERDKELCFTGMRLIDQRRFDRWHLNYESWKWLPISEAERIANPNF